MSKILLRLNTQYIINQVIFNFSRCRLDYLEKSLLCKRLKFAITPKMIEVSVDSIKYTL